MKARILPHESPEMKLNMPFWEPETVLIGRGIYGMPGFMGVVMNATCSQGVRAFIFTGSLTTILL